MYKNHKVIDVHGHLSSPPEHSSYGFSLVSTGNNLFSPLKIPDESMQRAASGHVKLLDERGIDLQLLSMRPVSMLHWERPYVTLQWTRVTNDAIHQTCRLYPDRFRGVAGLPQQRDQDTSACLAELDRCINELGFVAALVNPDPAGDGKTPKLDAEYWYPLYRRAGELDIALIIHACQPKGDHRLDFGYDATGDAQLDRQFYFMMEHTLATMILERSDVFARFPRLKIVVVHCGGAPDRLHPRRQRNEPGGLDENLYFDTCAYDRWFLTAAFKQRGPHRMLFGTETPGAGSSTVDPETGKPSDDLVPVIDSLGFLTDEDKQRIFYDNPIKVFGLKDI
jgi:predicted TIM-barrel fold metal-dependent hydrolase